MACLSSSESSDEDPLESHSQVKSVLDLLKAPQPSIEVEANGNLVRQRQLLNYADACACEAST